MGILSSLKREQKEAVVLLQIGTFLEYFDLMLYIHMAVLLNDLFFPKTDPHTAAIISAFAFCSTYVLRPFGALLFGYIGDNIGRKTTIIFTTMMMALTCVTMANLPTYAEIGIAAAWIVTFCRMIQGISSMGEISGAEVYLTEITKRPYQYPIVALLSVSASLGPFCALAVASLVTTTGFNWRAAFWVGACIALVGSVARTRLRETPEFADMKRRVKKALDISKEEGLGNAANLINSLNRLGKEKVNKKTFLSSFLIAFGWPVFFYFTYIHCGNILKNKFGFTPEQVIHQNFIVSIFQVLGFVLIVYLSTKIAPVLLVKVRAYALLSIALVAPFIMDHLILTPTHLLILQCVCIFFPLCECPAMPVFLSHYPIFRRFTCSTLSFALSRMVGYIITSFGIVFLTEAFGNSGLWLIMIPTCLSFLWALNHFETLEKKAGENPFILNPNAKAKTKDVAPALSQKPRPA